MVTTTEKLLGMLEPVILHILGVIFVLALQRLVKLTKATFFSLVSALLVFITVAGLGYVKTSNQPNYFKLLRVTRYPTTLEVKRGLDRLEDLNLVDSETILEMDSKLAGNASLYYWKGHDMFGDEYPGLEFSAKLSTSKEGKFYRIIGSSLMIFYLTFTPMPISCPKQARLRFAILFLVLTIGRLALFELYPEYLGELTKKMTTNLQVQLPEWSLFSAAEMCTFLQVGLSLGFLTYYTLVRTTREGLVEDLQELLKTASLNQISLQERIGGLVSKYTPLADAYKQRERSPKLVGGALLIAGILFPAIILADKYSK